MSQSAAGSSSDYENADASDATLRQFSERLEQVWSIRRVRMFEGCSLRTESPLLILYLNLLITLGVAF